MPLPNLATVKTYLGTGISWTDAEITSALASETAAQAAVCTVPVDPPADLAEALCRRVAHNLAVRALPLGIQASMSEAAVSTNRVGGTDAEVARLEAPYRKVVIG
jgi:hypothetical protein